VERSWRPRLGSSSTIKTRMIRLLRACTDRLRPGNEAGVESGKGQGMNNPPLERSSGGGGPPGEARWWRGLALGPSTMLRMVPLPTSCARREDSIARRPEDPPGGRIDVHPDHSPVAHIFEAVGVAAEFRSEIVAAPHHRSNPLLQPGKRHGTAFLDHPEGAVLVARALGKGRARDGARAERGKQELEKYT